MTLTRYSFLLLAVSISLPVFLPPVGQRLVQVIALLTLLAFALEVAVNNAIPLTAGVRRSTAFKYILAGLALLVVAGLASAIDAAEPVAAVEVAVRYSMGLFLIVALVASHRSSTSLRLLAGALVLGACCASLIGATGYLIPEIGSFSVGVSRRAKVFFDHPNQLGMVLSSLFFLPLARLTYNPLSLRDWSAVLILGAGVALSGSMANVLLILLGGLALFLIALRTSAPTFRLVLYFYGGVIASALLLFGSDAIRSLSPRIGSILDAATSKSSSIGSSLPSLVERLGLYSDAWSLFVENPVAGIGGDNAHLYLSAPSGRPINHAHNYLLDVFMSMGLPGAVSVLVFVLGWLIVAFQCIRRRQSQPPGLSLGVGFALLAFFISNQSSDSLGGTIVYLTWVLLGMALALLHLPPNRQTPGTCKF